LEIRDCRWGDERAPDKPRLYVIEPVPLGPLNDLPRTGDAPLLLREEEFGHDDLGEEGRARRSPADLIKGSVPAVLCILSVLVIWHWPDMAAVYRAFRAPAAGQVAHTPDRSQASSKQDNQSSKSAQRVVLYEEDPADPNGKRLVGSAIWHTETVTPGPGQPSDLAIRADVEVPDRKLAMTWSLRRNTDQAASHTVELMFKLPTDFPPGGISNVPAIMVKQLETTRGVPLVGIAVRVSDEFYLIGLSNAEAAKERNLQLLKERGWFDIGVVYNDSRRAILTMEKGAAGERAFVDAFKAWKQ
jgi:hypothetical protein